MMENQNNNFDTQPTETVMEIKPRRVWWKFAVGAVIILILAGGGYWAWDKYFSSEARENQGYKNRSKHTRLGRIGIKKL